MAGNPDPAPGIPPSEKDEFDYKQTRFWRAAGRYGFRDLVVTAGSGLALVAAGALVWLYLDECIGTAAVKALGIAYTSLGAALFGIVLAGLAVVAAFFDREYVAKLREAGTLSHALFGFWWVAALAVAALVASVALTVAAYADAARGVTAAVLGVATTLFFAALFEALGLVGTMMRHGLYRAELAEHRDVELRREPDG